VKPEVGFKWHNGSLETVTFPRLYATKPLEVVAKEFKQMPDAIVLTFSMKR
jgi:hypothetical protein